MTRRLVTSAVVLLLSASSLISAQTDTAKRPAPKKPDLELTAARQIDLDTDEGTWISVDVSPDGRTIVFDLLGDLYTMPITGGTATALTSGQMYDAQPRFSPDGKSIVFTSDRNGGDNVWTMDLTTKATVSSHRGKVRAIDHRSGPPTANTSSSRARPPRSGRQSCGCMIRTAAQASS